ncbi:MAG: hypothetical protein GY832_45780 [Chloroflexi bacterium]|nr:hypothetical protein [Chloroflexota bacterium]
MNNNPIYVCFILTIAVASLLLLGAGLSLPSQAAPSPPTSLPDETSAFVRESTSPAPAGGLIELRVEFSETWSQVHCQELWTVVEWRDEKGVWRTVQGWQGILDSVSTDANNLVIGKKMWWVATDDLGRGPFRWAVYRTKNGRLLGRSELFYLPDSANATEIVDVTPRLP